MQHFDVRLKAILQGAMPRLLRLLGLPDEVAEYLTVEFPLKDKALPDLVLRFADGRIVHFEIQSRNDGRMLWRCLEYYRVMAELWPGATAIVQIVLYLGDGPVTMVSELSRDRLTFGFEIFRVQHVEAQEFLDSESDDERILAVLGECEDPRAMVRALVASWRHLPAKELGEKLVDLQVLSQLRNRDTMVKEEVSEMPIEIDITQNAMYKWGQETGEAKGEARGEARGVAKGEAKGEAKALTRVLTRRFGALPESVRARIASADIDSLDRWLDRVDSTTLDDVFAG